MHAPPSARTVATVMSADPIRVAPTTSVAEVAELLDAFGIGGVPVVDGIGRVAGVISQADLVHVRASGLPWNGWHGLRVADVMTQPAFTVAATDSVTDAAALMDERRVHRLVVVDENEEPIGVVTVSDIVREIADACDDE
jgi:tRNA nucleotidyltransferase (CCA-adding enzyme)